MNAIFPAFDSSTVTTRQYNSIDEVHPPSILVRADHTVSTDREKTYGRADVDFTKTADVLTSLGFCVKNMKDGSIHAIKAEHIPIMMIAVKLSRILNNEKCWHEDSWQDIAGYVKTAEIVHQNKK